MGKKIKKTKTWTIKLTEYEDGKVSLNRTNDGFNGLELLGLAFKSQMEILQQIAGDIKPTVIRRKVVRT